MLPGEAAMRVSLQPEPLSGHLDLIEPRPTGARIRRCCSISPIRAQRTWCWSCAFTTTTHSQAFERSLQSPPVTLPPCTARGLAHPAGRRATRARKARHAARLRIAGLILFAPVPWQRRDFYVSRVWLE